MSGKRELGWIKDALIQRERGMPVFWLHFEFPSSGQGFGGYVLDGESGMDAILSLMDAFGVEDWSKLAGRYAYALREDAFGSIIGVESTWRDGGKSFTIAEWRHKHWPEKYRPDGSKA